MNRHRLLVVEDDTDIRDAMVDLLNEHFGDAVGVANGALALNYLESAPQLPCLILLDLMMPVMAGDAFRAAQLENPRIADIPVVVVSAYRDVRSHAEKLNASAFITKPPSMNELAGVIDRYCKPL